MPVLMTSVVDGIDDIVVDDDANEDTDVVSFSDASGESDGKDEVITSRLNKNTATVYTLTELDDIVGDS